jgi:hypothetical protein
MNALQRWLREAGIVSMLAVVVAILPTPAGAHGGGPGLDYDPCARDAGPDNFVHFAAYQPAFDRFAEYCGNVPRAGRTLLVFDLVGTDLTGQPVALEITRADGQRWISLPARRYPAGVIDVEADLAQGDYDAMLTIGAPPTVYRVIFDVSVRTWWYPLVAPVIIASMLLLAATIYCFYQGAAPRRRVPRRISSCAGSLPTRGRDLS